LEVLRFQTVYYFPRLTRIALTLTGTTGHFISGLTLHIKCIRPVEKLWYDIFITCNWVDTRWQYTFTHKQYIEQHK